MQASIQYIIIIHTYSSFVVCIIFRPNLQITENACCHLPYY